LFVKGTVKITKDFQGILSGQLRNNPHNLPMVADNQDFLLATLHFLDNTAEVACRLCNRERLHKTQRMLSNTAFQAAYHNLATWTWQPGHTGAFYHFLTLLSREHRLYSLHG
jgi:hypothetical protein